MLLALPGLVLLGACSKKEETNYSQGGELCVFDEGQNPRDNPTQKLEAGKKKYLTVIYNRCASGCTVIKSASCTAKVEGERIVVNSQARTETRTGSGVDCPAACVEVRTSCAIEGEFLPGKKYSISNGGAPTVFEVPGVMQCQASNPGEKPGQSTAGPSSAAKSTGNTASGATK